MLDDTPSAESGNVVGHSVIYVCPKGFSGSYELLVRRVWGKLTTGKVSVEAVTHFRTNQAKREFRKIALDKNEALVKFDLGGGRRKESLRDQQVLNAAIAQVGVNRQQQILGQQLAALAAPGAVAAPNPANPANAGNQPGVAATTPMPFPFPFMYPNRGVGYMPVIITLPEGTSFGATGVVSADRRYVRVTSYPLFSRVSDVHTFSFESGSTQNTPGIGSGGSGFSGLGGGAGAGVAGGGAVGR